MKYAKGNEKLGSECYVVSRPVGDTCPSHCFFLGVSCYAEATEKRFVNARTAGFANVVTDRNRIRSLLLLAANKGLSIRWHERGDFFKDGELDTEYIDNIRWACQSILSDGHALPDMWTYSHIYEPYLVEQIGPFIKCYASVHNRQDKKRAEEAGYTLFAWCDTDNEYTPKKKKGKAGVAQRTSLPKLAIIDGERFIMCPEMRRGRQPGGVTCTGNKQTIACNMCVKGLANVLFQEH